MKMLTGRFKINNPKGIHGRVAGEIARIAEGFDADIVILHNGETANGDSILEVLSLGIPHDSCFTVQIQGPQAMEAMTALGLLFEQTEDP